MIEPYGKPRYVREREIFYDELPPDVASELVDVDGPDNLRGDRGASLPAAHSSRAGSRGNVEILDAVDRFVANVTAIESPFASSAASKACTSSRWMRQS